MSGTPFAFTLFSAVSAMAPGLVLAGSALGLFIFAQVVLRGQARWLIMGEDNRYSNSKFQLTLWFATLISAYLATIALRWSHGGPALVGGVDIPANLLMLSGMSAMSFAGAKQIVSSRIARSGGNLMRAKPPSRSGPRFPSDLITDDSGVRPDLGDFQMLVVTLLAVSVYLIQICTWLGDVPLSANATLPDVDQTILGTFGIGQATYLVKKYVGDSGNTTQAPGPVLNQSPPRPS